MRAKLSSSQSYRLLNVIDDFNREEPAIEVDLSLPAERVIRTLSHIVEWRGKPDYIRCDNGPEYINHLLAKWAQVHQIKLFSSSQATRNKTLTLNVVIERFVMTGQISIYSVRSTRYKILRHAGFGYIIMKDRIRLLGEFLQHKNLH